MVYYLISDSEIELLLGLGAPIGTGSKGLRDDFFWNVFPPIVILPVGLVGFLDLGDKDSYLAVSLMTG